MGRLASVQIFSSDIRACEEVKQPFLFILTHKDESRNVTKNISLKCRPNDRKTNLRLHSTRIFNHIQSTLDLETTLRQRGRGF